jgi:DNA-binding beta-propeller fold protein YncE
MRRQPVSPSSLTPLLGRAFLFFIILSACACSRAFELSVDPPDALLFVDGRPAAANRVLAAEKESIAVSARKTGYVDFTREFQVPNGLAPRDIEIDLEIETYQVTVDVLAGQASYEIDGSLRGETPFTGSLEYGAHRLVLSRPGWPDLAADLEVRRAGAYVFRMQPVALPIKPLGVFPCGRQPKQVIFSPGDRFLYIPLLDGEGFQIFDMHTLSLLSTVPAGPQPRRKAFPEGLFIEKYRAFLVSQMSTNSLFEYEYSDDGTVTFRRALASGGVFPKFMAWCERLNLVAVSNWISNDVALIDYASGKIVKKIGGLATPRGLAFSADGNILYIASYDGGNVFRYDTGTWKEAHRFFRRGSCMRHIVLSPDGRRCFISDMSRYVVYELDADTLALLHTYKASWNTNTIGLDSRGRYLFISNRGPNNKINYTLRSPEDGKVLVYDTANKALAATIAGGNQPTGLDVSADDRYLVFTNFLDRNFEIYDISGWKQAE